MAENLSPEERLFKVIQEGKQERSKDGSEKRVSKNIDEWIRGIRRFIFSIGARQPGRAGRLLAEAR